jgi:predicted NAD/FAD-binding protein
MSKNHIRRVGVIGSGVAGLPAAYVVSASAEVTVFEADDRLGGHADTHPVPTLDGPVTVDTGFIVHNEKTYPTLMRLFAELGVRTQASDMSMSVRSDSAHRGAGLEWAGALGWRGLFPSWRALLRPAYLRMLTEVPRFHRRARRWNRGISVSIRRYAGRSTLRQVGNRPRQPSAPAHSRPAPPWARSDRTDIDMSEAWVLTPSSAKSRISVG